MLTTRHAQRRNPQFSSCSAAVTSAPGKFVSFATSAAMYDTPSGASTAAHGALAPSAAEAAAAAELAAAAALIANSVGGSRRFPSASSALMVAMRTCASA